MTDAPERMTEFRIEFLWHSGATPPNGKALYDELRRERGRFEEMQRISEEQQIRFDRVIAQRDEKKAQLQSLAFQVSELTTSNNTIRERAEKAEAEARSLKADRDEDRAAMVAALREENRGRERAAEGDRARRARLLELLRHAPAREEHRATDPSDLPLCP